MVVFNENGKKLSQNEFINSWNVVLHGLEKDGLTKIVKVKDEDGVLKEEMVISFSSFGINSSNPTSEQFAKAVENAIKQYTGTTVSVRFDSGLIFTNDSEFMSAN